MPYIVIHRLIAHTTLVVAALLPGCSIYPKHIIPEVTLIGDGHEATVAVQTSDSTSRLTARTIDAGQVESALTIAIRKGRLFSRVVSVGEADYLLSVHVSQARSQPGADTTATFATDWKLTEADTGKAVWSRRIRDLGHGDAYESAFGSRRRDLALERAARKVLRDGLQQIGTLRLRHRRSLQRRP